MKKQIKKLVKKTYLFDDYETVADRQQKIYSFTEEGLEKLAELIVAECLAVCAVNTDDEPLYYKRGVIFAMNRCQQNIKEHFGVEE